MVKGFAPPLIVRYERPNLYKMAEIEPVPIDEHSQAKRATEGTPLLSLMNRDNKKTNNGSFFSRLKERVFLNSKAANLIIVWNLLMSSLYGLVLNPNAISQASYYSGLNSALLVTVYVSPCVYGFFAFYLMFYPLAGYVADVRLGRYKTVVCCSWTIWVALLVGVIACAIFLPIIFTVSSGFSQIVFWGPVSMLGVIGSIVIILFLVSFAGFRANVIQFGMDQLQNSSLFIFWYLITLYTGIALGNLAWSSIFSCQLVITIIGPLTALIFLIVVPISLCIGHKRQRWFVLNPDIGNPYKLVRNVVSFARKHQIPVKFQRSAFTYWEDDIPRGLDLGKSKYGGPFTTEQVEDVKAFFGILKVLLCFGPFFMADFAASDILAMLQSHMSPTPQGNPFCSAFSFVNGGAYYPLFVVLGALLFIFVLQHFVQKYIPSMLKRVGIGMFLITLSLICSFAMDTIGHGETSEISCFTQSSFVYNFSYFPYGQYKVLNLSPNWLFIQSILIAVAYLLIYGGIYEFICAQSPHSMKGLLIGLLFAIQGLFQLIGALGILLPFAFWQGNLDIPSCGFVYYLINIIISIVGLVAFTYAAKKYQYRQRDDFCDERRYIEEYDENEANHNPVSEDVDFGFDNVSDSDNVTASDADSD